LQTYFEDGSLALDLLVTLPEVAQNIPFRHKYTLRFSVRACNLTNHFNPLDVHANLSDPLNGVFFGHYVLSSRAILMRCSDRKT
jgi:hypothetical protein